jgi:hypothetical protein
LVILNEEERRKFDMFVYGRGPTQVPNLEGDEVFGVSHAAV